MKNSLGIMIILTALLCGSCEQVEEPSKVEQTKDTLFEIVLKGTSGGNTRATADNLPSIEDEGTITAEDVWIGIFNADGTVNAVSKATVKGAKAQIYCSAGINNTVVVVANCGSDIDFSTITNKDAFLSKTVALSATVNAAKQDAKKLPMSGEITGITLASGVTSSETVTVSRLVSRISINSIKTDFDSKGQYKEATFKLQRIFLYNVINATCVNATMPTTKAWLHGGTSAPTTGPWITGTSWLLNEVFPNVNIPLTGYITPHWFYAFTNDGTTKKTKLVIAGEFDADGSGSNAPQIVYYPIVVNKAQLGTTISGGQSAQMGTGTIERNATYTLSATIKGKGSDSPETDIIPVSLDLTVTVADWALKLTQTVTFN